MNLIHKFGEKVKKLYEEGASSYRISKELGISKTSVVNILHGMGVKMRSKSEGQKNALANGCAAHPTEGRERTAEEKTKISRSMEKQWAKWSKKKRQAHVKLMKKLWEARPKKEREEMSRKASLAILEASKYGSKIENKFAEFLSEQGFDVVQHKKHLIGDHELEIDILLPSRKVVIEVDGPTHFLPIWGDENLEKTQASDIKKDAIYSTAGYHVIRIQVAAGDLSVYRFKEASQKLLRLLGDIQKGKIKDNPYYLRTDI